MSARAKVVAVDTLRNAKSTNNLAFIKSSQPKVGTTVRGLSRGAIQLANESKKADGQNGLAKELVFR